MDEFGTGKNILEEDIAVSIVCIVYNHEKYVADAIESFLAQETSFNYEILIHDDASTDSSAQIIRKYVNKRPELIRPIYQDENQYSKGINISEEFLYPRCRGKYIAYCEGDDYWSDPHKLQKQYEALEMHPEIDICACGSAKIDAVTGKKRRPICPCKEECVLSVENMIMTCPHVGDYIATNTFFFRKEVVSSEVEFRKRLDLDYTLRISGALRGGLYYIPDIMGVYRSAVPGSWTTNIKHNKSDMAKFCVELIEILEMFDDYTDHRYADAVDSAIKMTRFDHLRSLNRECSLLGPEYAQARSSMKGIVWFVFYLKAFFIR